MCKVRIDNVPCTAGNEPMKCPICSVGLQKPDRSVAEWTCPQCHEVFVVGTCTTCGKQGGVRKSSVFGRGNWMCSACRQANSHAKSVTDAASRGPEEPGASNQLRPTVRQTRFTQNPHPGEPPQVSRSSTTQSVSRTERPGTRRRHVFTITKTFAVLMLGLATVVNTFLLLTLQRQLLGADAAGTGQGTAGASPQFRPRHSPDSGRASQDSPSSLQSDNSGTQHTNPRTFTPADAPAAGVSDDLRLIGSGPKPQQPQAAVHADWEAVKLELTTLAERIQALREGIEQTERDDGLLAAVLAGELNLPLSGCNQPLRFIFVPPGTFAMGYSEDDRRRLVQTTGNAFAGHNASPAVLIKITKGFFILDRELTRDQFASFERASVAPLSEPLASKTIKPAENPKAASDAGNPASDSQDVPDRSDAAESSQTDTEEQDAGKARTNETAFPVTGISWREAVDYCEWIKTQTGFNIRLPTEIEWEYAARGPWPQRYPWSEHDPQSDFPAWTEKGDAGQSRVSDPESNPDRSWRRVFDLGGNVSEWCLDGYLQDVHARIQNKAGSGRSYEYDPVTTPLVQFALKRSKNEANPVRAYRGGSFKDQRWQCEVSCRRSLQENESSNAIGFRPVLLVSFPRQSPP